MEVVTRVLQNCEDLSLEQFLVYSKGLQKFHHHYYNIITIFSDHNVVEIEISDKEINILFFSLK
jgi:hypothetical protein